MTAVIGLGCARARQPEDHPSRAVAEQLAPAADLPARPELPPTTGPRDLPPLDPTVLPPLEERWTSPVQLARHRRVMDEIWATRLGQLYLGYLTLDLPPETMPGRARQLLRILSDDADMMATRVKALQLLTNDFYARGRLTGDAAQRAVMLKGLIDSAKDDGNDNANAWMINGMIGIGAASLPFGSELVNTEVGKFSHWSRRKLGLRKPEWPEYRWAEMRQPRAYLEDFKFKRAGGFFLKWYGLYSIAYGAWVFQKSGWMKYHRTDEKLLNGRDELLEKGDL